MGWVSKAWKSTKKAVKKVAKVAFKPIQKLAIDPLKKVWANKYGRMLLIGAAIVGGGVALSGLMAGGTGIMGAGTAATTSAGAAGASAAGTATATAAGTAGAAGTAAGTAGAAAGAGAGAASTAATAAGTGLISEGLKYGAVMAGGQMVSGAMAARGQEKAEEDQRKRELEDRDGRAAYGVTYDGKKDAGVDTGGLLMEAVNAYQPGQSPNLYPQQDVSGAGYNPAAWRRPEEERV